MSDSELSTPADVPTDSEIEQCLKRVTREGLKSDDFTVNKARVAAEKVLGLENGFLKSDAWKTRSKDIVNAAVEEQQEPSSPEKPKKAAPKPRAKPAPKAGAKRKSDETAPKKKQPRKKARKEQSEEELSEPDLDDEDEEFDDRPTKKAKQEDSDEDDFEESDAKPKKKAPAKKRAPAKRKAAKEAESVVEDSEASEAEVEKSPPTKKEASPPADGPKDVVSKSDSELSEPPKTGDDAPQTNGKHVVPEDDDDNLTDTELIDEPPKKKRQKKSASDPKSKAAKPTKAKAAKKELSPDEEQIKRLQGWLIKCGLRKMWSRELAKCDTSKAKIKHLKKMLEDAGMTGRYSEAKAQQIKDSRELAAELEAVQEFGDRWGQEESEEEGNKTRPKRGDVVKSMKESDGEDEEEAKEAEAKPARRLPKGLVDFGDSGDEGSD